MGKISKKLVTINIVFTLLVCCGQSWARRIKQVVSDNNVVPENVTPEPGTVSEGDERTSKLLPFFALVTFGQSLCKNDAGLSGVCVKKSACTTAAGGTVLGTCAQGFGSCCQITLACSPNPAVVTTNGTILVPGTTFYPLCQYVIPKQPGVCQIRLDFTKFQIDEGPTTRFFGDCDADTLTISGQTNAVLGEICGIMDGQHMYLDYGPNDKINLDIFRLAQTSQTWNIMVTMIKCDSPERAPDGCLQYFTEQRMTVKSFNFQGTPGHQLNNEDYSICVRTNPSMKKITWKSCGGNQDFGITGPTPNFGPGVGGVTGDMCTTDWLMIYGNNKYCGTWFPDAGVSSVTQPFMMQVHFDKEELLPPDANGNCQTTCDDENSGFCMMYAQTPN